MGSPPSYLPTSRGLKSWWYPNMADYARSLTKQSQETGSDVTLQPQDCARRLSSQFVIPDTQPLLLAWRLSPFENSEQRRNHDYAGCLSTLLSSLTCIPLCGDSRTREPGFFNPQQTETGDTRCAAQVTYPIMYRLSVMVSTARFNLPSVMCAIVISFVRSI